MGKGERNRDKIKFSLGASLMHFCKKVNEVFTNWGLKSTFGSDKTLYKVICCTVLSDSKKSSFLRYIS